MQLPGSAPDLYRVQKLYLLAVEAFYLDSWLFSLDDSPSLSLMYGSFNKPHYFFNPSRDKIFMNYDTATGTQGTCSPHSLMNNIPKECLEVHLVQAVIYSDQAVFRMFSKVS